MHTLFCIQNQLLRLHAYKTMAGSHHPLYAYKTTMAGSHHRLNAYKTTMAGSHHPLYAYKTTMVCCMLIKRQWREVFTF